jgi:hypothetical protein
LTSGISNPRQRACLKSARSRERLAPDLIDYFFIVDGDLNMYLIPSRVIAGRVALLLRTYKAYIAGNASGLLGTAVRARSETLKVATRTSA